MPSSSIPGRVATLGMFILDTFEYEDAQSVPPGLPGTMQIGGGGTFAAVGSRIWLPPDHVKCIVDRGSDFPEGVLPTLEAFGSSIWIMRDDPSRKTTSAANIYRKSGRRDFEYRTPRLRLTFRDLLPSDLSQCSIETVPIHVHLLCAPERLVELIEELDALKEAVPALARWEPTLVYEPLPSRCSPPELDRLRRVAHRLHCLSPNHEEAASFFDVTGAEANSRLKIEGLALRLLELGCPNVIVRSGAAGAFLRSAGDDRGRWVPPYVKDQRQVVDVTGCGNAFLGGYIAGLARGLADVDAAVCGTISAGLVLMQFGLPGVTESDGVERWDGINVEEAMRVFSVH